jgi:hypothetical protein
MSRKRRDAYIDAAVIAAITALVPLIMRMLLSSERDRRR